MKISFLTTWETKCGIADYSKYFVDALLELGLDIKIVKPDPSYTPREIENIIPQMNNADIAHIQFEPSFFKNYDFKYLLKAIAVPIIITMHEEYPAGDFPRGIRMLSPYYLGGYIYRIFMGRKYYKTLNKLVSKFIVHSTNMKSFLRVFGTPNEKIVLFPLPVPLSKEKIPDIEKNKEVLSLSGKKVLAIFGFINNRKGYEIAIEALRNLPEEYVLIIAGDCRTADESKYTDTLKKYIEKYALRSRVRFTGFLSHEDISLIMSAADIILAPFKNMSNSSSLSVALSYGKAIIASDLKPNRQIYKDGDCLFLFKASSASGLKQAIEALMNDASYKKFLENKARLYAETYSYKNMAEKLYDIYRQVKNENNN